MIQVWRWVGIGLVGAFLPTLWMPAIFIPEIDATLFGIGVLCILGSFHKPY